MNAPPKTRCGFAAVIGLPNVGKSTLVNTLVGTKVSIVSRKVQTTRNRILGILISGNTQIILMDTPGIFSPQKTLEKAMVRAAWDAVPDADVLLHLVDAADKNTIQKNRVIIEKLPTEKPVLLVLNKVDKVKKPDLLALTQTLNEQYNYNTTFMVSALNNQRVQDVLNYIIPILPDGPFLFDENQITDMPMRLMAAEITREKIFDRLHQELPYAIMVYTERWENFDDDSVKIDQIIYVQRASQKGIVLGKGGRKIKEIGETARKELEDIMETRVHLKLFVKVQENWAERPENYALMGLEF